MGESVKLSRAILSEAEYRYAARFKLFVTLLFLASRSECEQSGVRLKRGELVTSINTLAAQTLLSVKQVRRGLDALKKAGRITTVSSPLHTVINICNFDSYVI